MPQSRNLVVKAIQFAARAHAGQLRKVKGVSYIWHPLAVGRLLEEAGCAETVVVAGVLHDTLEDTRTTGADLRRRFGKPITGIVEQCSEPDQSHPWEYRKKEMIRRLKSAGDDVKCVVTADKIDNLRDLFADQAVYGEKVWSYFHRGRESQEWYFRTLWERLDSGSRSKPLDILMREFDRQIAKLFREKV
ncbi:MAG: HD domain-containing protein [Acidobacteriota bacterium]